MAFRFFTIPITSADGPTEILNAFLRGHRIIKVDRQLVDQGTSSLWVLCVEYLDGVNGTDSAGRSSGMRAKTDYKEILSESDFAVFARLRDARKAIAQAEAVPVYTIFTNEQLAQMVSSKATTRSALAKIDGLGDARLEKYGKPILDILSTAWKDEPVAINEAGGKPV
jgi:superfamily II DNA helicase RecQ